MLPPPVVGQVNQCGHLTPAGHLSSVGRRGGGAYSVSQERRGGGLWTSRAARGPSRQRDRMKRRTGSVFSDKLRLNFVTGMERGGHHASSALRHLATGALRQPPVRLDRSGAVASGSWLAAATRLEHRVQWGFLAGVVDGQAPHPSRRPAGDRLCRATGASSVLPRGDRHSATRPVVGRTAGGCLMLPGRESRKSRS